jgi:competence protein ComEC
VLLALWCLSFAFGIACAVAGALRVGVAVTLAAAIGTGGVALVVWRGWRAVGGGLSWTALGLALGAAARAPPRLGAAAEAAIAGDRAAAVVARVVHGPEAGARGARLVVQIETIDGRAARERLSLAVVAGWPDHGPGTRLRFSARLRPLRGLANPDLPDPTLGLRSAGIDLVAGVADAAALRPIADPEAGAAASWAAMAPRRLAFRAQRAMRAAIDRALPGAEGAFLRTAVLGDRRGVGDDVEAGFRASGATHVLSVSGLHLAAVAVIFLFGLRRLLGLIPGLALRVDPRALAAAAALPAVGFFTLLTGEAVATERSAVMIAVALAALLVNRAPSPPATLGAAGLALLLGSPLLLFDVSLQLSFASVAGIALLARALGPRGGRAGGGVARRAGRWLWRFGAATLSATVVTAPLSAHWFGEIAPASPLGNLLLVPIVELGVVPFGLAGAALGAAWPRVGHGPLVIAGLAARLALAVAEVFRRRAPVWLCRTPDVLETAAFVAAGALAIGVAAGAVAGRRRLGWAAAAAALVVGAGSLCGREVARRLDPDLRVTFLDVGQGDAALVEAPGGAAALVDGGGSFDGSFDPGERVIEPVLRARGISRLDLVALSHPHPDHLNGLHRILQRFPVARLWTSGDDGHNPEYGRLLATAARRGAALPVPQAMDLGPADVVPLGPWQDGRIGAPEGLGVNDASLVVRFAFAGRSVLFTGDLEADGEGELAGRTALGDPIASDILKVPHHGSRTSSTGELLDAVRPRLAVISLGWRNRFHFPSDEVVARYAARGIRLLRTDRDGAVTVRIDPAGHVAVVCARGCPAGGGID